MRHHAIFIFFILIFIPAVNAAEIKITSPTNGAIYKQGDSIKISATTDLKGEITFASVLGTEVINKPPYAYEIQIPENVVGSVRIWAGFTDAHVYIKDEVEITILPRAKLELMDIVGVNVKFSTDPPAFKATEHFSLKETNELPLYIWGRFSDGELHNLQDSALKIKCTSVDSAVIKVTQGEPNFENHDSCWISLLTPGMGEIKITVGEKSFIQKIQVYRTEDEAVKASIQEPFLDIKTTLEPKF